MRLFAAAFRRTFERSTLARCRKRRKAAHLQRRPLGALWWQKLCDINRLGGVPGGAFKNVLPLKCGREVSKMSGLLCQSMWTMWRRSSVG